MKKLLLYALFISSSIILLSPLNAFADSSISIHGACLTGGTISGNTWCNSNNSTTSYTINSSPTIQKIGFIQVHGYSNMDVDVGERVIVSILVRDDLHDNSNMATWSSPVLQPYSTTASTFTLIDSSLEDLSTVIYNDSSVSIAYYQEAYLYTVILEANSHYTGNTLTFRSNLTIGLWNYANTIYVSGGIYDGSKSYTDILLETIKNNMGSNNSNIASIKSGVDNVNNSINNSSTSDANNSGNSFFNGFRTESFGHLTDIITAPLTLFSAMTSTTCSPITLNVDFSDSTNGAVGNNNVVLPCGTTLFWENSSLGSKVSNFRTFWNILLGAPLIYGCLLLLVKSIDSALDPLNDELITLNVSKNDDKRIEKIQKQDELKKQARGGS